jgi:hypothetical protein
MNFSTISSLLLILGGIVILAGVGLAFYQYLKPSPPDPGLVEQFVVEREQMPTPLLPSTLTPNPIPTSPTVLAPTNIPTPSPTPYEPYVIENIRYAGGAPIELDFHVQGPTPKLIELPQFIVHDWREDIFDDPNFFKPGDRTAVSYQDDAGRVGIWAHSGGRRTTMYPLQSYLEQSILPDTPDALESFLLTGSLVGSDVDVIVAGQYVGFMRVAAAVRVPPLEVPELLDHVMDIIPFLAENHDTHFQSLINNQQVVFLYFCGLALEGEERNPDANKWTQARFVIALTSSWEGPQYWTGETQ